MFVEMLKNWWKTLLLLVANNSGEGDGDGGGDGSDGGGGGDDGGDGGGDGGGDDSGGDADADGGKDGKKNRAEKISMPRDRFDRLNNQAKKGDAVEALVNAGILIETEDGVQANPNFVKGQSNKDADSKPESHRFTKEDVDKDSWPLVEKINKQYDNYDRQHMETQYYLQAFGAQLKVLREFPESIAKDSPLRNKAINILKNDKEFKKAYLGNPEAVYWAFKRASGSSEKKSDSPVIKKKGKFIVNKGDGGGDGKKKTINLSTATKAELDAYEKSEHERIEGLKKK